MMDDFKSLSRWKTAVLLIDGGPKGTLAIESMTLMIRLPGAYLLPRSMAVSPAFCSALILTATELDVSIA